MIFSKLSFLALCTLSFGGVAGLCAATASVTPEVTHVVVSHDASEFAGWPANEGCWSWGDEIFVGYTVGPYLNRDGKHSIDPEGKQLLAFSRSHDGGLTWSREQTVDAFGFRGGEPKVLGEALDYSNPGFAWKLRYGVWHYTMDRGHTWSGPYALPDFGDSPAHLMARTNYLVTGPHAALVFLTSSARGVSAETGGGRSFVARTEDGGRTLQFLSWIGPDLEAGLEKPESPIFSTMPSAVQVGDNHFVCALRQRIARRKWTDVFESRDGGASWTQVSELERGSTNPASLMHLGGDRIAAVYGSREKPFGIRAKLSDDAGHTWSDEIILRADGRTWDLGYVRTALRPDGTIVAIYYYSTEERPEQQIAATLWKPMTR